MRPRLAAALALFAALAAAAVFATGAVGSGASEQQPDAVSETPVSTPTPGTAAFDEIDEAIDRLVEAVRQHAQQQAPGPQQAAPQPSSTPEQPAIPEAATPDATSAPPSPEPQDASADPDCVTYRESRPGVEVTSVRCQHRNVTQDGTSSSVSVSSSSSISVSSSSTTTP
jgi:hypothetical protein